MTTQKNRRRNRRSRKDFQKKLPINSRYVYLLVISLLFIIIIMIFSISPELTQSRGVDSNIFSAIEYMKQTIHNCNKQVIVAHSFDGFNWIKDNITIEENIHFPTAIIGGDSKIRLYATNCSYLNQPLVLGVSDNGYSFDWSYTGFVYGDTTSYFHSNGHDLIWKEEEYQIYRTLYFEGVASNEIVGSNIATSYSGDGIVFGSERYSIGKPCGKEAIYESSLVGYPDVIKFNRTWYMFVSKEGMIYPLESINGAVFSQIHFNQIINGSSSSTVLMDGFLRMFYNKEVENTTSIFSAFSIDGYNWTEEGPVFEIGEDEICDPSVVKLNDSFWLMYYVSNCTANNW